MDGFLGRVPLIRLNFDKPIQDPLGVSITPKATIGPSETLEKIWVSRIQDPGSQLSPDQRWPYPTVPGVGLGQPLDEGVQNCLAKLLPR